MPSPNLKNNSVRRRVTRDEAKAALRERQSGKSRRKPALQQVDRQILHALSIRPFMEIGEIRFCVNRDRMIGKSLWAIRSRVGKLHRRGLVTMKEVEKKKYFDVTDAGKKALKEAREGERG